MISKFEITLTRQNGQEALRIPARKKPTQKQITEIRTAKDEIIAELKRRKAEEKAKYEARQAKIAAIEGIQEIRKAIAAEEAYQEAFNEMMEDEYNDGAFPPKRPEVNSRDLMKQYPRATAYLKAESWSLASNYAKIRAGQKALERIINGEDHNIVIAEMEKEWSDYCKERMWD